MFNIEKIILILFLVFSFGTKANEPKFPKVGLLYISGLGCDEKSTTEKVLEKSIQYYLTSESFYKLTVTDKSIESTVLPYPDTDWLQIIHNLPNKPPGCTAAIAIQDSSLSVAKFTMERYKIDAGRILKGNGIYYWGN